MNGFTQAFDNLLDSVQSVLMSTLTKLGPFFVALMPSSFLAYAIYHTFEQSAGHALALFFALVVGAAWETVGIVACHVTIDLYNAVESKTIQPVKFWLMLALIPVYVLGVAGVVYFSQDAFVPLVKGLGVASPFLTTIVYTAVALARDLRRIEAKQTEEDHRQVETEASERQRQAEIEAERRRWEQDRERLEMQLKHAEKLARIDAKKLSKSGVNLDNAGVNQTVQNGVKNGAFDIVNLSREEQKQRHFDTLIDIYLDSPKAGVSQVAKHLGVSRQTVYNYLEELEQAGKIHQNGAGVEVLR